MIDLAFPVVGSSIPEDHGYLLYGALSRILPELHEPSEIAIHPIGGDRLNGRRIGIVRQSRMAVRLAESRIAALLPLAGKSIQLGDATLRIGVPEVHALVPTPTLRSRLVVVKAAHVQPAGAITEERFAEAVRKQLDGLGASAAATVSGLRRRVLRVRRNLIVGFEVVVSGLSNSESLAVQEAGVGGRRKMGCGVFTCDLQK